MNYRDNIDVALFPLPKAREATLKPINAHGSSRASLRRLTSSDKQPIRTSTASSLRRVEYKRDSVASSDAPASFIASSRHSSSSHATESVLSVPRSRSNSPSRQPVLTPHVSVGLTKGACLPGQTIHVLVKVDNHHKAVWRRNGIIVTLHREGRTDFQPNLPLSANAEGQGKYEDYYPRSRSGIGGMSMDNAGSDKKFQQDLSQTIAPLLIDPGTMSAEIKVAVRVPMDAIPTIKGVPGNMISFRYYVETIIDIQGKLSMHDRAIAGAMADPGAGEEAQMTIWAPNCIDTTSMRQHKHAVRLKSELIIGTSDSTTSKDTHQRHVRKVPVSSGSEQRVVSHPINVSTDYENGAYHPTTEFYGGGAQPMLGTSYVEDEAYDNQRGYDGYEGYDHNQWGVNGDYSGYDYDYYDSGTSSHGYSRCYYDPPPHFQSSEDRSEHTQPFIPLPSAIDEEELSEKQKLARHEAALLPSQPEGTSSFMQLPSAPPPLDVDDFVVARVSSSPLLPHDQGERPEMHRNQSTDQTQGSGTTPSHDQSHDFATVMSPNGRSQVLEIDEQQEQNDRGSSRVRLLPQAHIAHEELTPNVLPEDAANDGADTVVDEGVKDLPEAKSLEVDQRAAEAEPQGPIHG